MKLWLLASGFTFFLFLVFFARQFIKYNLWFGAWLAVAVAMQILFATAGSHIVTRHWVLFGTDLVGWALIGGAAVSARARQDAVNGIIADGLGAVIALQLVAVFTTWFHGSHLRALAGNVAALVPTGYMLVRFTFMDSDLLPLLVSKLSEIGARLPELAQGAARAMFS